MTGTGAMSGARRAVRRLLVLGAALAACPRAMPSAWAQDRPAPAADRAERGDSAGREPMGIPSDWPSPVNDRTTHTFLLFENLEYDATGGPRALQHDVLGWYGGDVTRLWVKSEGRRDLTGGEGNVELQALYGRLIMPYFDLQLGVRVDNVRRTGADEWRGFAVVALQGLAPYRFEIEPALYIDDGGRLSARFTGSYDLLLTQRLVLQPRTELGFAAQDAPRFGVTSGFGDFEVGARLRYEIRREFAPYVGLVYAGERSLGLVAGVRAWL